MVGLTVDTSTLGIEEYAKRYGRLHPHIIVFLQPYFDIHLDRVRVNVKHGPTSIIGGHAWVMRDLIVVQKGKLNAEYIPGTGNTALDLSTRFGMRTMAHECFHVQQWLTRPWWKSISIKITDFFRSMWYAHRTWSHKHSKIEQAAMAFERAIDPAIRGRLDELKIFESLR